MDFSSIFRWPKSCTNWTIYIRCFRLCRPCKRPAFIDWPKHGRACRERIKIISIDWPIYSPIKIIGKIYVNIWRAWNCRASRIWDCFWPIWCTLIWRIRIRAAWSRNSVEIRWTIFCVWSAAIKVRTMATLRRYREHKNIYSQFVTLKSCRTYSRMINTSE